MLLQVRVAWAKLLLALVEVLLQCGVTPAVCLQQVLPEGCNRRCG
jgi:hypothetical protein